MGIPFAASVAPDGQTTDKPGCDLHFLAGLKQFPQCSFEFGVYVHNVAS